MESKTHITKKQIAKDSTAVFQRLGYNAVTMADIADATKMGRSSLYYYFKNKDEVFAAVAKYEFSDILEKAKGKIKSNKSFYDNFLAFNKERLSLINQIIGQFENLLKDIRENPNIIYSVKNVIFDKEFDIYRQMLIWGLKRQEIAPISAEDLNFLISNMIYAFKGLEQEIFLFGKIEELMNRLEWISSIISKGLK